MNDKQSLIAEIETGVALSAFLGTVALFFTGILISQLRLFNPSIKVPILYLIISTFSFIFSASVYANAGGEMSRHDVAKVHSYMAMANNISEFLGLYLFVIAIPLVINAITADIFLRLSVAAVALIGLMLYSQSSFSILHRELSGIPKAFYTLLVGALGLALDLAQTHQSDQFVAAAGLLLGLVLVATLYFCFNTKQLTRLK